MTNEEVHTRKTIRIPKSPLSPLSPLPFTTKPSKGSSVDFVVLKTGASKEEALFYLEENHWNVNHAVADILQDQDWEKEEKEEKEILRMDDGEVELERKNIGCLAWLAPTPTDEIKLLAR